MVDHSRLKDLDSLLDFLYEKLGVFELEICITNSVAVQVELKQRIKREIMPSIRKYEAEYWELYPQDEIVCSEEAATSQLVKVERAVNAIELIPATTYPPELIPLLQDLQSKLAEPDRIASAKLKVALPLIPAIASYEFELETEGLMSQAWKSIKGLARR
jgi:hypothetical protein